MPSSTATLRAGAALSEQPASRGIWETGKEKRNPNCKTCSRPLCREELLWPAPSCTGTSARRPPTALPGLGEQHLRRHSAGGPRAGGWPPWLCCCCISWPACEGLGASRSPARYSPSFLFGETRLS